MVGHTFGSYLAVYLRDRDEKYKAIREALRDGTDNDAPIPASWPAGRSILTALPTELMLLVCYRLYQADLLHLAQTCRSLTGTALDALYARDVSHFDCLAVRWACTLGVVPALERAFFHGASPNHEFGFISHFQCKWAARISPGPSDAKVSCNTPLTTAIAANQIGIMECLINRGVDTNWAGLYATPEKYMSIHDGLFPIHWAMGAPDLLRHATHLRGNADLIRRLLDAGADPNKETLPRHGISPPRGFTPLLMAMQDTVSTETVELLLERGARPAQIGTYLGLDKDVARGRPSHIPWQDLSPLGAMLFCYGEDDPYFRLDMGKTQLLLMHGATLDIAFRGVSRQNPYDGDACLYERGKRMVDGVLNAYRPRGSLDLAIPPFLAVILWAGEIIWRRENPDTFPPPKQDIECSREKLCETMVYLSQLIAHLAVATGNQQYDGKRVPIPTLIDAMVTDPLNTVIMPRQINGQTALRFACRDFDHPETPDAIRALLHAGADINAVDPHGCTALHRASLLGPAARVRALVTFRGQSSKSVLAVNACDNAGWTALHYACLFYVWDNSDEQVTTVRLLLEAGAEVRPRTKAGWTPLSLAVLGAHHKVVQLLLDAGAEADDLFRSVPTPAALPDGTAETALVPIGRVVFDSHYSFSSSSGVTFLSTFGSHCQVHRWPEKMEAALAKGKQEIATQLRSKLGIAIIPPPHNDTTLVPATRRSPSSPAPAPLPRPTDSLRQLSGRNSEARFAVEAMSEPFGMPDSPFVDFVSTQFEKEIDDALDQLDAHGLSMLAIAVSQPEWLFEALCWRDPSQEATGIV